jgi:hypothetical protein
VLGITHVGLDEEGLASGFANQAGGFVAFLLAARANSNVRSFTYRLLR